MHSSEFSALYTSSYKYIYQLVYTLNHSHQAAEDTVQDIYLAAWIRFRDASHPNPLGWLTVTARHKTYDLLRRQYREAELFVYPGPDTESALSKSAVSQGDFLCLEDDLPYSRIRPLLRRDEFDLILAHYNEGVPINELAGQLHISPSACYMRLHRARKKLSRLIPEAP